MVKKLYCLLILTITALANFAFAQEPVQGYVKHEQETVHLVDDKGRELYELKSRNYDVYNQLQKLESGDFLIATGTYDQKSDKMIVEAVDFVGLRKLLGYWKAADSIFNFKDFNVVNFYLLSDGNTDGFAVRKARYQYSVAPGSGSSWKVFFNDFRSITLTSIEFKKDSATMEVYDPETGISKGVIQLNRLQK